MQRRIAVLAVGGTISMARRAGGGIAPKITGAELIAALPRADRAAVALEVFDAPALPSGSLTFAGLLGFARRIAEWEACGFDGVVVIQGTDTMEETAFLLDLVCPTRIPVVVTGAMRSTAQPGADGPANLVAAIRAAASPQLEGAGVVIVMADEIHPAIDARKVNTTGVAAFRSPNRGLIGRIVEGRVIMLQRLHDLRPTIPLDLVHNERTRSRVGLITMTLDDDGELLRLAADRFDGLVVAGFGGGHVPSWVVPELAARAVEMPVVLASRTLAGGVLSDTYSYQGSERDLLKRGLLTAGMLDPLKARIALTLMLRAHAARGQMAAALQVLSNDAPFALWPWPVQPDSRRRRRPAVA